MVTLSSLYHIFICSLLLQCTYTLITFLEIIVNFTSGRTRSEPLVGKPCVLSLDMYHLFKHSCSPNTPHPGNGSVKWQDNASCYSATISQERFEAVMAVRCTLSFKQPFSRMSNSVTMRYYGTSATCPQVCDVSM